MVRWFRMRLGLIWALCVSVFVFLTYNVVKVLIQKYKQITGHDDVKSRTRASFYTLVCFLYYLYIPKRIYLISLRVFIKSPKVKV